MGKFQGKSVFSPKCCQKEYFLSKGENYFGKNTDFSRNFPNIFPSVGWKKWEVRIDVVHNKVHMLDSQ